MEEKNSSFCLLPDPCKPTVKLTNCIWPLLNTERPKPCQAYCPIIQPIKGVRFKAPVNKLRGAGSWTNLMYRPIIQGGLRYYGVDKLVPFGPPPSSPVLCRPAPVQPTDSPGLRVYCAPKIYCMTPSQICNDLRTNLYCS